MLLLALSVPAWAEEFTVSPGLSAYWYNPDRNGEGLVLEILDEESAVVYWFTYDEAGKQLWLLDVGAIDGDRIVFPELTVTRGGRFGPKFDPDAIEQQVVGEAVLSFSNCDSAEWSYSVFGHGQSLAMTRLTQTMGAGCQPLNGVPGQPISKYAGQSGSWYDLSHAGEGFVLQWLANGKAILIWFSYDSEGEQYWMLGTGHHEAGRIEFPMLNSTHGARFGEGFDSEDVEQREWGSLSLELGCSDGQADYQSELPGFGSGEFDLTRLSRLASPDCPYQAPSLSDLYEFKLQEIEFRPVADTSTAVMRDLNIASLDIADDGTVVSSRGRSGGRFDVIEWSPETGELTVHEGDFASTDVWVTPDKRLLATRRREISDEHVLEPLWLAPGAADWQVVPGLDSGDDILRGVSVNGDWLAGTGRDDEDRSEVWIWSEAEGRRRLPIGEGMFAPRPYDLADDGGRVVGQQSLVNSSVRTEVASRWVDGGAPRVLRDSDGNVLGWAMACSARCDVVAGTLHGGEVDLDHPRAFEFWVWTEDNGHHYLGEIPGAVRSTIPPSNLVWDSSADGSVFVGRYLKWLPNLTTPVSRPVLWTQATGLVALEEVLDGVEGWDDNWEDLTARAVSPDGRKMLLEGEYRYEPEQTLGRYARAQVLTLTPRR
ncbi:MULTISPECIES: hypothetical protein [unclassified Wenzhouxiangella]|uniref:hypothetical protein n=1 Tax=unclassified Wenzhouxiangella TaxID=2613841 RepID=UPI0011C105C6|nr:MULTISPECIES: hypothetical protein [unclassified Wenzhouxiangella]